MSEKIELVDIHEIMSILPHRYPFLLVDKVIDIDPGLTGIGIKNVTVNEPYFQGHFSSNPVMPNILLVEAMAQAACIVVAKGGINAGRVMYLLGVDQVFFKKDVRPGDQVRIHVRSLQNRGKVWKCEAIAKVDGEVVAEAILIAMGNVK